MSSPPVVVVTGASAGLGRSIAHAYAKLGASIGLIARNPEALAAAAQEVEVLGGRALVLPLDVADADAVEAAAGKVEDTFGPITVWINNAMASVFSPVKEMQADEYKRVTDVTYLGYVYGTLAALKRMLPRDRGTIVQVGSALSYRSIPLQSAYCASKHAINGFTDSLRCELHHDSSNVRLTAVHMPAMNTPQFDWVKSRLKDKGQPVPPIYDPELCAEVVLKAGTADHPQREYWVGMPTVAAIVGTKFIPGLLDVYLGKTGYKSQQEEGNPRQADSPDNLFHFVPGTHSARGRFTDRSSTSGTEVSFLLHRKGAIAAALGLVAIGGALLAKRGLR